MVRVVNAEISRWVKRAKYCAPCSDRSPSESGILVVEIIEQDQVEIGGRRHLAAAEPAHREDRGLLPLDAAVLGGELIGDQAMHGVDDALGDVGKGDAGLLRRHRAGQDARADQEQALLPEQPQAIEKVFVGVRVLQRRRQPRRQFLLVRHRAEEARIDQPVHDLRLARQHVAEPRRGAEDQRHQRHQIAVLAEQRDQPAAALQRAEEAVERGHRVVGLFGMREAVDQAGNEFDEGALGRLDAERAIIALPSIAARVSATMTGFLKPSVARCSSSRGSSGPAP